MSVFILIFTVVFFANTWHSSMHNMHAKQLHTNHLACIRRHKCLEKRCKDTKNQSLTQTFLNFFTFLSLFLFFTRLRDQHKLHFPKLNFPKRSPIRKKICRDKNMSRQVYDLKQGVLLPIILSSAWRHFDVTALLLYRDPEPAEKQSPLHLPRQLPQHQSRSVRHHLQP